MYHEVVESKAYPGHWHVEAIDNEGRVYIAVFSGPSAMERAAEYADWKNKVFAAVQVADVMTAHA